MTNLSIKEIFRMAIRQIFYNFKFVFLLWALSAVTALILSVPIFNMMQDSLGRSFLSDRLESGFDYLWLVQFREIFHSGLKGVYSLFLASLFSYLLIQNFFSGGLIAIFNSPKKNHILDFFYGGVKYWFRFLKILLISLLLYAVAFLLNDFFAYLIQSAFVNSEKAMAEFLLKLLKYILLIFLIGMVAIISDYSKVLMVADGEQRALTAIKKSTISIKRNFNQVFSVFLVISITGAIGAIIYNAIGRFIPRTPYYFLVLTFILQQMLVIFRLLIRMLFYSTEVLIYKDISAEVIENNIQEARS